VLWRFYGPRSPGDASVLHVDPTEGARWFAPSAHPKPEAGKGGPEAKRYLTFRDLGAIVEYAPAVEAKIEELADRVAASYAKQFPEVSPSDHAAKARREVTRADAVRALSSSGSKAEKARARDQAKELLARACSAYRAAKRVLREEAKRR
jgi:hypothetical protein